MTTLISAKRGIALLLALCLGLSCLAGCGKKSAEKPTESVSEPTEMVPETTEETTEPTTIPTTEATEPPTTEAPRETEPKGMRGVVAGDSVNIRSGPGTNYGATGMLPIGTMVYVQEVDLSGILPWGKTEDGWICLNYVQLDNPEELLEFASGALGITLNDNIQVYNGPGTFYGKAGLLPKDRRLNIFGIVCNWARIAEGWLLVDHIYIDCTEGPEPPVMGTVTGSGVNIRSGPGTHYNPITAVNKGTRMKIFYVVEMNEMKWGCGEVGWISMDFVELDNESKEESTEPTTSTDSTTETTPAVPPANPAIIGSWSAARAYRSADGVACFTMGDSWTFNSDGTFQLTQSDTFWIYNADGTLGQVFESAAVNKSGTFTYDGTNLAITLSDGTKGGGTASVEQGVLTVSWGSGRESMYTGSAAELAAKLFSGA